MYFLRYFQQVYDKSSLFFVKISNANITRQIYTRTHIKTYIHTNTYITHTYINIDIVKYILKQTTI